MMHACLYVQGLGVRGRRRLGSYALLQSMPPHSTDILYIEREIDREREREREREKEFPQVGRPLSTILPVELSMRAKYMHEK